MAAHAALPTWTTCRCPHPRQGDSISNHANGSCLIISIINLAVFSTCCSLQLAARLDLVHDHPRFAPSSGLPGAPQTFSPEQSASFTSRLQDFSTILDPHDHFLSSQRPPKDEDFSFVLEEAVESLHIQQEVVAALHGMRPQLFTLLQRQTVLNCRPQGHRGSRGRGLRQACADPQQQF